MPVKQLRCDAFPDPDVELDLGCDPWRRSYPCSRAQGHPPPHRSPIAEWEDGGLLRARHGASVRDQAGPPPEVITAEVRCKLCGARDEVGWGSLSTREEALAAYEHCGRCAAALFYAAPDDTARPTLVPWRLLDLAAQAERRAAHVLLALLVIDERRAVAYLDQILLAHAGEATSSWRERDVALRGLAGEAMWIPWPATFRTAAHERLTALREATKGERLGRAQALNLSSGQERDR